MSGPWFFLQLTAGVLLSDLVRWLVKRRLVGTITLPAVPGARALAWVLNLPARVR